MKNTAVYELDFKTGWAVVSNAFTTADPTVEMNRRNAAIVIRKRIIKEGYDTTKVALSDETDQLEDWIRRRDRNKFKRPAGTFVFRIIDKVGDQNIGREELTEWPVK